MAANGKGDGGEKDDVKTAIVDLALGDESKLGKRWRNGKSLAWVTSSFNGCSGVRNRPSTPAEMCLESMVVSVSLDSPPLLRLCLRR